MDDSAGGLRVIDWWREWENTAEVLKGVPPRGGARHPPLQSKNIGLVGYGEETDGGSLVPLRRERERPNQRVESAEVRVKHLHLRFANLVPPSTIPLFCRCSVTCTL